MNDRSNNSAPAGVIPKAAFAATQWSVVLAAGKPDEPHAQEALARLCQTYWYPLYVYARRRGCTAHDAQDLTQSFFQHMIEHRWISDARQQRGRFRSFLLTAMSRFMAGQWDKAQAQKRGGAALHLPIQTDTAETRYGLEPVDHRTPEQSFERQWAVTLLDVVLHRLKDEYQGKAPLFAALQSTLAGRGEQQPYAELAVRLGMSEGAIRVAVHRLRHRYRQILREEIAETLNAGEDVETELRHLFAVLAGP